MNQTVKGCMTCIKGLKNRKECDGCLDEEKDGHYLYANYQEGDRVAEHERLEKSGEINQVIGHTGEYEINSKWDIKTAMKSLVNVCEHCGGLVFQRGETLILIKAYEGSFKIEFNPCRWKRITEKEVNNEND